MLTEDVPSESRKYSGASIVVLLKEGGRAFVELSSDDLDLWCDDFDLDKDDPKSWHHAISLTLDGSSADDDFFLEGETTLHIRRVADIVGFSIHPKRVEATATTKLELPDKDLEQKHQRARSPHLPQPSWLQRHTPMIFFITLAVLLIAGALKILAHVSSW